MKNCLPALALVAAMLLGSSSSQAVDATRAPQSSYGTNAERGRFVDIRGIRLYVEDYGSGSQAVLVIHGNGGDIATMSRQLDALVPHYRVIAADSRGQGRSEIGDGPLSYEQMADDFSALLDVLRAGRVHVFGFSDGGIVGLLLAMRHPDKVAKLAITGANLNPGGAHEWAMSWARAEESRIRRAMAQGDSTSNWPRDLALLNLLMTQPNIDPSDLAKISAPTLVMSGDNDIIRLEHTLEIAHRIPRSQLAIFPGTTHFVPWEQPEEFNAVLLRFFQREFRRPETRDLLK